MKMAAVFLICLPLLFYVVAAALLLLVWKVGVVVKIRLLVEGEVHTHTHTRSYSSANKAPFLAYSSSELVKEGGEASMKSLG
jgi:hypothetical protein